MKRAAILLLLVPVHLLGARTPAVFHDVADTAAAVFAWDAETIAVLHPRLNSVELLVLRNGEIERVDQISLKNGFSVGGGAILPDHAERLPSGDVVWMSRARHAVGRWSQDGQSLATVHLPEEYSPFWAQADEGGVWVQLYSHDEQFSEIRRFNWNGRQISRRPPWIGEFEDSNELTGQFFFTGDNSDIDLEVLAYYPWARTLSGSVNLANFCDGLPGELPKRLLARADRAPFNSRLEKVPSEAAPAVLSVARDKSTGRIVALLNGGLLVTSGPELNDVRCEFLDLFDTSQYALTSVTQAGNVLAVLALPRARSKSVVFLNLAPNGKKSDNRRTVSRKK